MSEGERNRGRMTELLERWRVSGRTLSAFARAERISRDKLEYWRRRLGVRSSERAPRQVQARRTAVSFAPVHMTTTTAPVEITLPDGVRVAISEGVKEELVTVVLSALRRPC